MTSHRTTYRACTRRPPMKCFPNSTLRTSRRGARRATLGGVLAVLLGTIAVLGSQGTAPPVAVAGQGDFAGLVDIGGGRRLYLECRGSGGPTVVLEAGYRSSARYWS